MTGNRAAVSRRVERVPRKPDTVRVGRMPPVRLVDARLHHLIDPLATEGKALADSLKSPALSPESGDGGILFAAHLGVRMGMFDQELSPSSPPLTSQ
jgi:hypothetical protein